VEKALSGTGKKEPSKSEGKNIEVVRKSLHVNKSIKKGSRLKEEDVTPLRPGDGISPMDINKAIGLKTKRKLEKFTQLHWGDLT
jgi:N-acetylneuraminate synthase/N,N'-diacetyllegionaminate synthase